MRRLLTLALCVLLTTLLAAAFSVSAGAAAQASETAQTLGHAKAKRGYIMWYQAKKHVGQRRAVKGPVKSTMFATGSSGRPTFINVGKKYPNKGRFTIVIWGKHRSNFPFKPEVKYRGKTVIATGKIKLYQGSAQVFVSSPSAIKIAR